MDFRILGRRPLGPRRSQSLGRYRNLLSNGPHKRAQLTSNCDHDLIGVFAACTELPIASAEAHLGFPTDVLHRLEELFESELQVPTHFGGIAISPGPFYQGTPGMGISRLGDAALTAPLTRRVFRGR